MNEKIVYKVSTVSIIWNVVLSGIKLIAGVFGKSGALISDAVHSLSDVISTVIVIIGTYISNQEDDEDHPYGHDRFECVAAIILSILLVVVAFFMIHSSFERLSSTAEYVRPLGIGIYAAALSIIVKEGMYWYTRHYAKMLDSSLLMADAWHHRSDAFSSVGALVGIVLEQMNVPKADTYAELIISLFIIKVAYDVFKDAVDRMVDKSCDEETLKGMRKVISSIDGVEKIDLIKTRVFGSKMYIDIEISADGNLTLKDSHDIAENVHDTLEREYENVKHCMVHVNPV